MLSFILGLFAGTVIGILAMGLFAMGGCNECLIARLQERGVWKGDEPIERD